ncbi:MAG TPA: alcohol dehydrogenase catalytic domain-containing protein [Candidatus Polarisedimenticolia bacterium]
MAKGMMRAVVLREFGGPENLHLEQVEAPAPASLREREVLIKVQAVGVCYHDIINRSGNLPRTKLPSIMGHEIAGEVVAVGSEVQGFRPADRVASIQRVPCGRCDLCRRGRSTLCKEGVFFGEEIPGGYAEYVVSEEQGLARIPPGIGIEEASICACTIGTAIHVARTRGGVQLDETVLITGASGGVGLHAIQVCRLIGARVYAVTSSPQKEARLREAGADEVIVSPDLKFASQVRRATGGRGVDVVLEITGALTFDQAIHSLAPAGRMIVVGNLETRPVSFMPGLVILKEIEIRGSFATTTAELAETFRLVGEKKVRPVVSRVMPLAEVAKAHQILYDRGVTGRIVLTV